VIRVSSISIERATRPFRCSVAVPGSKSITNRALPLAAMACGESVLDGVLFAEDTEHMLAALEALGYEMEVHRARKRVRVVGRGADVPAKTVQLACGNSGTTIRFLTAMVALGRGSYVLDGIARMRERPIDELVVALRSLGARIDYEMREGFPPIRVAGDGLRGGTCTFADAKSSQFISAVLMAAPYAAGDVEVALVGPITSEPYVDMTLRMMAQFGVDVAERPTANGKVLVVPRQPYTPRTYSIEPDASNASYFLAAAAITQGASVTIPRLGAKSLQGDVHFIETISRMGARTVLADDAVTVEGPERLRGIDVDMAATPDMVQTLAVVALFAEGPTTVRNVWNLRIKETDRLDALERELAKLGARVSTGRDWIRIEPPAAITPASIATYDDHRMAMAFSIAGLRADGVVIENPECTRKTYPEFFDDLAKLRA